MPVQRQLLDILSRWDDCSGSGLPNGSLALEYVSEASPKPRQIKAALEQTIETEIIPRLLLAHRLASGNSAGPEISEEDVNEFTHLVLEHEMAVAAAYIDVLCSRGLAAERVIMDLLAPAARRLGYLWEQDERDFVQVTIGLSRIQHLVRALSPTFQSEAVARPEPRHALLAPTPGEQHTLGIMIVEEFFRRSGWQCMALPDSSIDGLCRCVSGHNFDVVGLSTSCDVFIENAASAIDTIRKSSKNQKLLIVVGGPLFRARPELVDQLGADAKADDGTQALATIGSIFSRRLAAP